MLMSRLKIFFGAENFVYIDPTNQHFFRDLLLKQDNSQPLNIVLAGGFFARIVNCSEWPKGKYKIWVLCSAAKSVLCSLLKLPAHFIGVIPRYELFPRTAMPNFFSPDAPSNLVFAGRICEAKGIFPIMEICRSLQIDYGFPINLHFIGDFLELDHPLSVQKRAPDTNTTKQRVRKFIADSKWNQAPRFISAMAHSQWTKAKLENPIFISLSDSSHEDFGVSLAQAQAAGWPSILSAWGAHHDAAGIDTILLPAPPFGKAAGDSSESCESLCAQLLEEWFGTEQKNSKVKNKTSQEPQAVSLEYLALLIEIADRRYPKLKYFSRRGFKNFILTKSGFDFFKEYHRIFSNPTILD